MSTENENRVVDLLQKLEVSTVVEIGSHLALSRPTVFRVLGRHGYFSSLWEIKHKFLYYLGMMHKTAAPLLRKFFVGQQERHLNSRRRSPDPDSDSDSEIGAVMSFTFTYSFQFKFADSVRR